MPSRGEGLGPPCSVQAAVSAAVWRLQVARGVGAGSRHAGSVRQGRAERGAETPRSSPPIRSPGGGWCRQDPGDGHRWPPGHRPHCAAPAPRRRHPCRAGCCHPCGRFVPPPGLGQQGPGWGNAPRTHRGFASRRPSSCPVHTGQKRLGPPGSSVSFSLDHSVEMRRRCAGTMGAVSPEVGRR